MYKESILAGCVALTLVACGSVNQQQTPNQPAAPESGGIVHLMQQPSDTELRADVGGTIFKVTTVRDQGPTTSMELQYLGLAEEGRIKLRVLSADPETNESWRRRLQQEGYATSASGAVDFEHDPAETFLLESFKVELIEAQPSWIQYRIIGQTGFIDPANSR
jgi:hypothetical protein